MDLCVFVLCRSFGFEADDIGSVDWIYLGASIGGSKRDDGPLEINRANVFEALESLKKKKKKSDKESKSKGASKSQGKEQEKQVFRAPAPLTYKSWADVGNGDDDDDYYYATTSAPQAV